MKKILPILIAMSLTSTALAIDKKITYTIKNDPKDTLAIMPYIQVCRDVFECGADGPHVQAPLKNHPPIQPGETQTFTTEITNWNQHVVPFVYEVGVDNKIFKVHVACFGYQEENLTITYTSNPSDPDKNITCKLN